MLQSLVFEQRNIAEKNLLLSLSCALTTKCVTV